MCKSVAEFLAQYFARNLLQKIAKVDFPVDIE